MVTACYKPVVNGVTRMVSLYKSKLEEQGHQVYIFTLGKPDPTGDDKNVIRSPGVPLGDTGYYFSLGYSERAKEQIRQMDVLHCHHLFMSVDMASRYANCPIVYTNHTRYDLYTGAYTPLPQAAADVLMRQIWPELTDLCDVIIAPSESIRRVLLEFGVRRPIEQIPNGIELQPFREPSLIYSRTELGFPADSQLAVYVGRMAAEKDIDRLVRQFAKARMHAPKLHLVLVGDGPQRPELVKLAEQLGCRPYVRFMGEVDNQRVAELLAGADFFVTASDSEVHPLTVIEALAAGLAVVAKDSVAMRELISHNHTGLLCSTDDGGLAAGMVALAHDPARRALMGRAAQEESERYDIEHTVTETLDLYRRLLEDGSGTRERRRRTAAERIRARWPQLSTIVDRLGALLRP
ncbi:MAG: glycosyltransferase [Candidatus Promineifilaceae bacterium]|nr:glycosyltransferase [Candidatus Promineifilaceae bacterium]